MAKEIVLRFDAINKRREEIGYFGTTKETLQSLPRSGLVLQTEINNLCLNLLYQYLPLNLLKKIVSHNLIVIIDKESISDIVGCTPKTRIRFAR
jgi:hypothetical protein